MPLASHPVVGVGGLVLRGDQVLLIRRGKEPLKGRWVLPGGSVELGETLEEAVVREVREETGVVVRPREVVYVFDRIDPCEGGYAFHYVIIDYLCDYVEGEPVAASDAEAVAFVGLQDLDAYDLPPAALDLVRKVLSGPLAPAATSR